MKPIVTEAAALPLEDLALVPALGPVLGIRRNTIIVFGDTCAAAVVAPGARGTGKFSDSISANGDSGARCNEAWGFAVRSTHGADTPGG